jgi:hypothetical protein
MFHLLFRHMLQVCLSRCCICFIHMLRVFFLDVAYVLQWFSSISNACFKRFIYLHTCVASVVSRCFKSRLGVASPSSPSAASSWCLLLFLDAGDVRAVRARVGVGGVGGVRVVEWHRTRASGACSTEQAPGAGSSEWRGPV